MLHSLDTWWRRRCLWPSMSIGDLVERKADRVVTVLVPALNEVATIAQVVGSLTQQLVPAGLVDRIVVVDGGSVDGTATAAAGAGAGVASVPPSFGDGAPRGKGGALWWALQQVETDLVVFLDADVLPARASTVSRLLTPLLLEPEVQFVKAAFDRPLTVDGVLHHGSGGRVTELLARPLLNAWWPELAGFVQPLSGELAARRDLLARLPFATGYGLEIGMLIDVLAAAGLDAMAQNDIGERQHRHHSDAALGRMAAEVLATALDRRGAGTLSNDFLQFSRDQIGGAFVRRHSPVSVGDLPATAAPTQATAR